MGPKSEDSSETENELLDFSDLSQYSNEDKKRKVSEEESSSLNVFKKVKLILDLCDRNITVEYRDADNDIIIIE